MTNTQEKKISKAGKGLFDEMDRQCNLFNEMDRQNDFFTAAFKNLLSHFCFLHLCYTLVQICCQL